MVHLQFELLALGGEKHVLGARTSGPRRPAAARFAKGQPHRQLFARAGRLLDLLAFRHAAPNDNLGRKL